MSRRAAICAFAAGICTVGAACAQPQEYGFEAEIGTSLEQLTQGRGDWRSTYLDLEARNAARRAFYGRLRTTERFGQADAEAAAGTYLPFGRWGVQLEATASPTHHVLAKHSLLVQVERRFEGGWGAHAGVRRSEFEHTGTDIVVATVDRYFSAYRLAYSLYLGRPDGAGFNAAHRLQGSYYYGDRSFVGVAAYAGREAENVPPSGVLVSEVRGASLGGRHEFAPAWSFAWEVTIHRQGDLYTRRGFGIGLRHAF